MKKVIACLLAASLIFGIPYFTELGNAWQIHAEEYGQSGSLTTDMDEEHTQPTKEETTDSAGKEEAAETEGETSEKDSVPEESLPDAGGQQDSAGQQPSEDGEEALPEDKEEIPETAPEEEIENTDAESVILPEEAETEEEAKNPPAARNLGAEASLAVEWKAVLPLQKEQSLTVELSEAGKGQVAREEITVPAESGQLAKAHAIFENLEDGTYTVKISGAGYETYTQKLEVEQKNYKIQVMNSYDAAELYQEKSQRPGVMKYGDVNGDGQIDVKDKDRIIVALEKKNTDLTAEDMACDLNGDGQVSLVDLQYLTFNYQAEETVVSKIETTVITAGVQPELAADTTIAGGALADIFKADDSYVSLKPENGNAISEENPVELALDFAAASLDDVEGFVIAPPAASSNRIEEGTLSIDVVNKDGEKATIEAEIGGRSSLFARSRATAVIEPDGTISVDLGGQVAVKKVTIKVTKTSGGKLADIAKVEFLNDMADRIPAPEMDIPENLRGIPASKEFTVTWDKAKNVTGYEVEIAYKGNTELYKTVVNSWTVNSFGNAKLVNGEVYEVRVQSVNGDWRSGYSDWISVIPKADKKPDAPDDVSVSGAFRRLDVKWKKMEDTDSYTLYYKEKGGNAYQKIEGITTNSYTISGLKDNTSYLVYLTGTNELGTSGPSIEHTGTTANVTPTVLPKYKLLNSSKGAGVVSAHIKNVYYYTSADKPVYAMADSPLDQGETGSGNTKTAFGTVDNDFGSYFRCNDWDMGGTYPGDTKGVTVEFDQFYDLSYISLTEVESLGTLTTATIDYFDESGQRQRAKNTSIYQRKDENGKIYYLIAIPEGIRTNKVQVMVGRSYNLMTITIAEMNFHLDDSLEREISALYADTLHLTLDTEVTEAAIDELEERLNIPDAESGELHPLKDILERELDNARSILHQEDLRETISVHTELTGKNDGRLGFGGLNSWQPLGVTAGAGEELIVYVGASGKKPGDSTDLQLVASQYHGEASAFVQVIKNLKAGVNVIPVRELQSINAEEGGSLYVQYTGEPGAASYAVRVSGGSEIPVLDLYQITDSAERLAKVTAYVEELEAYVPNIKNLHEELHKDSKNLAVNYEFDEKNCILGATEIMLDQMMYSVSAQQILAGLKGDSTEAKAKQLLASLDAMDDMMELFYQHKGLMNGQTKAETDTYGNNALPAQHLNIRYQRMFATAFMYASGNHIGIEWGSVSGLATSEPIAATDGKYESGNYFGWGIAHEIGHDINQSAYAIAEITNNYFSVLAQAKETNDSVRFQYTDIYDKVTSGLTGRSANVFTQLGMYWQLHLAYDPGYNYKTYDNYKAMFNNLFYARVDTYARYPDKAPKPKDVALTLSGDVDQKFMRLACAAAQKNLLEFFERWGMVPDAGTKAYAEQFAAETRPIYYVNDEARAYTIAHKEEGSVAANTTVQAELDYQTGSNQVTLTISDNAADREAMLGYEIFRNSYENGALQRMPVGFVMAGEGAVTFTDTISTVNNRVFTYEVVGYDAYLSATKAVTLEPVKVSHGGNVDKTPWVVTTNMVSDADQLQDDELAGTGAGTAGKAGDSMCTPATESAITKIYDNDYEAGSTYTGKTSGGAIPEIVIGLGEETVITGFKYTVKEGTPISNYEVQVSTDGQTWESVQTGTLSLEDGSTTVYFEADKKLKHAEARYVKLLAPAQAGQEISITELSLLAPTDDNVELVTNGIGILQSDYEISKNEVIPKGSVIFTGTYKGNPAYNVVLLYDQDGNLVGGVDESGALNAEQVIFAPEPDGDLGDISEGIWVYYIPEAFVKDLKLPKNVRAELYRVDNAETLEGQRMVSDTLTVKVANSLPPITLEPGMDAQRNRK